MFWLSCLTRELVNSFEHNDDDDDQARQQQPVECCRFKTVASGCRRGSSLCVCNLISVWSGDFFWWPVWFGQESWVELGVVVVDDVELSLVQWWLSSDK